MGFSRSLAGFLLPQPKQKSTSERAHLWLLFLLSAVGYLGNKSVASTCPLQPPARSSFFCLHYQTTGLQLPWVEKASIAILLNRNGQRSGQPVLVGILQRLARSKAKLRQRFWGFCVKMQMVIQSSLCYFLMAAQSKLIHKCKHTDAYT